MFTSDASQRLYDLIRLKHQLLQDSVRNADRIQEIQAEISAIEGTVDYRRVDQ